MRLGSMYKRINANDVGLHELTDDELLRLQNILVDMMQDISDVCDEYGISWCLFGGSALGCIRYKGFIPWDEDMDIYMMRKDFCKFRKIFKQTLSSKYVLQVPGDKGYLFQFPRVYKKGTYIQDLQSEDNTQNGVFIDIFLMENVYKNKFFQTIHGIQCTAYLLIDSALRTERCKKNILTYSGQDKKLRNELNIRLFLAKFFHFWTLEKWLKLSDRCFSKVKDETSDLVVAPSGALHYWGEMYNRKKMSNLIKMPFAGHQFYIMKDYDYYLKKRYGENYMIPPDEGERERHTYIKVDLGS